MDHTVFLQHYSISSNWFSELTHLFYLTRSVHFALSSTADKFRWWFRQAGVTAEGRECHHCLIIVTLQNTAQKVNTQSFSLSNSLTIIIIIMPCTERHSVCLSATVFAYTEALCIFNVWLKVLGQLVAPAQLFRSRKCSSARAVSARWAEEEEVATAAL